MEFSDLISIAALAVALSSMWYSRQAPVRQSQRELWAQVRQQTDLLTQCLATVEEFAKGNRDDYDENLETGIEAFERWLPRLSDADLQRALKDWLWHGRDVATDWTRLTHQRRFLLEQEQRLQESQPDRAAIEEALAPDRAAERAASVDLVKKAQTAMQALSDVQARLTRLERKA